MTEIATFPAWLRESLRCPATGAPLEPSQRPDGTEVLVAAGRPEHEYEVVDGVPVLLARAGGAVAHGSRGPVGRGRGRT